MDLHWTVFEHIQQLKQLTQVHLVQCISSKKWAK